MSLKFEIPAHISKYFFFKFQAQDSFFGRLGDLKNESHFLKKGTFSPFRFSKLPTALESRARQRNSCQGSRFHR